MRTDRAPWGSMSLLAAVVLSSTAACAWQPDTATAAQVAQDFHAAVAATRPADACDLLSSTVRDELEASTAQACPVAIETADLPQTHAVLDVDAFVRSARVVLDGDVVFVSQFADGWRVTAAGCTRAAGTSYTCTLKGG